MGEVWRRGGGSGWGRGGGDEGPVVDGVRWVGRGMEGAGVGGGRGMGRIEDVAGYVRDVSNAGHADVKRRYE